MSEEKNIIVDAKEKIQKTAAEVIDAAKSGINVTVGTAEKLASSAKETTADAITAATTAAKQDWKRTIASVLVGAIIMSLANLGINKAYVATQKVRYQEIRQASIEAVEAIKAGNTKLAQEKINIITAKSNEILGDAKTVVDKIKTKTNETETSSPKE